MELAEEFVVLGHGALALEDVNLYRGLVVGCGGECLTLAGRNGGVCFDKLCHDTAEGLDTYAQGHYVEQKDVLDVAGEDTALDGCAYSNDLVGVDALGGSLAEEFLNDLLDGGNTGRTAYEDDLIDVGGGHAGVLKSLLAGTEGGLDKAVGQLFELGAGKGLYKVLGYTVYGHDVR